MLGLDEAHEFVEGFGRESLGYAFVDKICPVDQGVAQCETGISGLVHREEVDLYGWRLAVDPVWVDLLRIEPAEGTSRHGRRWCCAWQRKERSAMLGEGGGSVGARVEQQETSLLE